MQRIAEKLEFMKRWVVTVWAKAGIGRKAGHEKRGLVQIFNEIVSEKRPLEFSR